MHYRYIINISAGAQIWTAGAQTFTARVLNLTAGAQISIAGVVLPWALVQFNHEDSRALKGAMLKTYFVTNALGASRYLYIKHDQ